MILQKNKLDNQNLEEKDLNVILDMLSLYEYYKSTHIYKDFNEDREGNYYLDSVDVK